MQNFPTTNLTAAGLAVLVATLVLWFWFDYESKHDPAKTTGHPPIRLFDVESESDYDKQNPDGKKPDSYFDHSMPESLEKQGTVSAAETELKHRVMAAERELDNVNFEALRSQNSKTYNRQQTVANTQLDIQLDELADFYGRTGNLAEQERLLKYKIEFSMATMPATCSFRGSGIYTLRRAYVKQKRFAEAAELAGREADILEQDPLYPNRWYITKLRRHKDSVLEKAR